MPRQHGRTVDWKSVDGAFDKPRRLHLQRDKNHLYNCPVNGCEHPGFSSCRGCRKHVYEKHAWYKYFDQKPIVISNTVEEKDNVITSKTKHTIPCYSTENDLCRSLSVWLQSTAGGGKSEKQSQISVTRALKFITFCCSETGEDESNATSSLEIIDYFLGSSKLLTGFLDYLQGTWIIYGQLGYITSISELLDFRKFNSPSGAVLQNFSVTEVYIKRAKKCLSKVMRSHWTTDLDIETLESRRSWASLAELQTVIPFHVPRYKIILDECKNKSPVVSATNLTFATRFLAVFMFFKVKGCRPMTYLHLTVSMFESAKRNKGMVDQTTFKTSKKYGFDSLYFDEISLDVVDNYVRYVRPLLQPRCDYLLLNRNGIQFQKLTEILSILVFQAIGKYVHPTRYRQIIETESVQILNVEEQKLVSEDQKHSSNVARVHYQKLRSRDVAIKGRTCMEKLRGLHGAEMDTCVQQLKQEHCSDHESKSDNETTPMPQTTTVKVSAEKRKPLRFTKEEDEFIERGIKRFGARWCSILRHPEYNFQPGREARTLRLRAIQQKLI